MTATTESLSLCLSEPAQAELRCLVHRASQELLSGGRHHEIRYPQDCREPGDWNEKQIDALNKQPFDRLSNNGNVYAIHTGDGDQWTAMYVGKSKRELFRQRMRSHLVRRSPDTGSQLDKVKRAVANGKRIAISYLIIKPEELCSFVEEGIIKSQKTDNGLPWNTYS